MLMQVVSWRATKLLSVNPYTLSIHTTKNHTMGRLSLQERGMAFGLISAGVKQAEKAFEATVSHYGKIDCLVNNAGWHPPSQTIDGFSAKDFRKLLDLNLVGYFLTCKYALPFIRKTKGSIVNVASTSGICGQAEAVTYSATKGGIIAMSKALAIDEAKHDVRVNTLSPGSTWTPLLEEYVKSCHDIVSVKAMTDQVLLRRYADIREMGKACLFPAADATFTTGENLSCSGGMEVGFGQKY